MELSDTILPKLNGTYELINIGKHVFQLKLSIIFQNLIYLSGYMII